MCNGTLRYAVAIFGLGWRNFYMQLDLPYFLWDSFQYSFAASETLKTSSARIKVATFRRSYRATPVWMTPCPPHSDPFFDPILTWIWPNFPPCRKRGEAKGDRQKSDQKCQKGDKTVTKRWPKQKKVTYPFCIPPFAARWILTPNRPKRWILGPSQVKIGSKRGSESGRGEWGLGVSPRPEWLCM